MKMSCRVSSTKTYFLELNQMECARLVKLMSLIDPHNLALQVVSTEMTDEVIEGQVVDKVDEESMVESLYEYGQMISMINELKFLARM